MLKKVFAILMIIVTLTFSTTLCFNRAHAAGLAAIPGYLDEAFAATMVGIFVVGAAATASKDWMDDNYEKVYETGKETWGKMSEDMKANFQTSLVNAENGVIATGNWITSALDTIGGLFNSESIPIPQGVFYQQSNGFPGDLIISSPYSVKMYQNGTLVGQFGSGSAITVMQYSANSTYVEFKIHLTYFSVYSNDPNFANAVKLRETLYSSPTIDNLRAFGALGGFTFDLLNNGVLVPDSSTDSTYNQIDKYLRDKDIPSGQLDNVYVPQPIPTTLDGTKLHVNDLSGQLALPDGTIYEGDYTWSIPSTGVTTVEGVDIPTTTTNTGDIVNIKTGEVVIPAETEVPPGTVPGEISKDKMADDSKKWGALVTTKFPFSLPWDFYFILSFLAAESKTPIWDIKFDYDRYYDKPISFQINLSFLDPYMPFFRTFIVLGFAYALILNTQRLLGGAK